MLAVEQATPLQFLFLILSTIAFGWITQIGDRLNVTAGVVLPLRGDSNRTFDYQIGLRGSYFFGATARSLTRAQQVTSF